MITLQELGMSSLDLVSNCCLELDIKYEKLLGFHLGVFKLYFSQNKANFMSYQNDISATISAYS